MIELINYCLGGDGGDGPGENPGGKWTKQLTECAKKKKRRIVHREKLRTLEVNREELRKLEVQQEKLNADRGEGDCIKFDLGDEDTFDVKECPVGPYLEGLSFEEIHKILTTKELQKDLPVCKNQMGNQTQSVFKCFTEQLCGKMYVRHVMLKYVPMNMF